MAQVNGTPLRIEDTLLVVEHFRGPDGTEYAPGNRVPLRQHKIRRIALERPEFFSMEYATTPVDVAWLADLDREYEAEYAEAKRVHGTQEQRRKKALRAAFEQQERAKLSQRELERSFKQQQAERRKGEEAALEGRQREALEHEIAQGSLEVGFHYQP